MIGSSDHADAANRAAQAFVDGRRNTILDGAGEIRPRVAAPALPGARSEESPGIDFGCETCPPQAERHGDSGSGQEEQGGRGVSEPPAISRVPTLFDADGEPELPAFLDRRNPAHVYGVGD